MSLLLVLYVGLARAATIDPFSFPSGFRPDDCAHFLIASPNVVRVAEFRKMTVAAKVRDVHAMAHVIYLLAKHTSDADVPVAISLMLDSAGFTQVSRRLRLLSEVPQARLAPYAEELLEITFKLSPLVALTETLDPDFTADLAAYFAVASGLTPEPSGRDVQQARAMAYLNLAMIQASLGRRAKVPFDLLRASHLNLTEARRLDHAGSAAVLASLPQILGNLVFASLRLDDDDRERMDHAFAGILRAEIEPYARGAERPGHFVMLIDLLNDLNDVVLAEHLPRLREAFDYFQRHFGETPAERRLH